MNLSANVLAPPYAVVVDEFTVWQQGNRHAGNMVPGLSDDWEQNLHAAQEHLTRFTRANQLVRIKPPQRRQNFIDLDTSEVRFGSLHPVETDGVITANPNYVLHANPADCGEIAVQGISDEGRLVLGLFHASRAQVDNRGYMPGISYLCETHGINPAGLSVRISPSARKESYAFPVISEAQQVSERWHGYIDREDDGLWHVDFHGRMLADLEAYGMDRAMMTISDDDTAHPDSPYFSHYQYVQNGRTDGGNGLLFAARTV